MGRAAKNMTLAAGLLWLSAVLTVVWMLTRSNPDTTWDWADLALTVAAAVILTVFAMKARRRSSTHRDGH